VEALSAERVHEPAVIVDDDVERPLEVARHRRRGTVAPHVWPHHPESPRENRHPRVPGQAALGVAVQQQERFRPRPRVGEVVDEIVHLQIG
jgi:hypothetical protein